MIKVEIKTKEGGDRERVLRKLRKNVFKRAE